MKMSKSGKATAAKAEEPASVTSLPKALYQPGTESASTTNMLSPQVPQLASPGPAARSMSLLPQLPLPSSNTMASIDASSVNQQEALLKLLSEQRSRDLLALVAGNRRPSFPPTTTSSSAISQSLPSAVSCLRRALAVHQEHQQQQEHQNLLLLARAEQELRAQQGRAQQQEQQRKENTLRMALLALKSRQNQQSLL